MASRTRFQVIAALLPLLIGIASSQIGPVRIFPPDRSVALFQGQTYTRLCTIDQTNVNENMMVYFEWLRDGLVVLGEDAGSMDGLTLTLAVDLVDTGEYSCRATLEDRTVIGPAIAGMLQVLDVSMIDAPPVQYIEHGAGSSQLNCSYPGAFTSWTHPNPERAISSRGELESPSFSDEGVYVCNIFYNDFVNNLQASLDQYIRLHIFVPVEIIDVPPAHRVIQGNPPLKSTVAFSGRLAQNMSITWSLDGVPLPSNLINNTYSPSQLSGTTELKYSHATRSHSGVYRVVIISAVGHGVFPAEATQQETSFQVDVIVKPTAPSDLSTGEIFSTTALFSWTLTNQNADEAADTLILRLTHDNGTFFRNDSIHGSLSSARITDLIPGTTFTADLIASNVDGEAASSPTSFTTLPGHPSLTNVDVNRINATHFTTRASLAYTGGGSITRINIQVDSVGQENPISIRFSIEASETDNPLVWTGEFSVTDPRFSPEGTLDFLISVTNANLFESEGLPVTVTPRTTTTSTITEGPEDSMALILIAVVIGTVLITLVVVGLIAITYCYCKRARNNKYRVSGPEDVRSSEEKQKDLSPTHAIVNRSHNQDRNLANHALTNSQTMQLGSVPSVHSDERYIENIRKPGHRRTPSNASSKASSKASHLSSTPSNSPNMFMAKLKNEQNAMDAVSFSTYTGSQLSQTESETQMPAMRPGHSYSQVRLTGSAGSSPYGSHQSIPVHPLHLHPTYPHGHRRNFSQTSSLGIGNMIKEEDSSSERLEYNPTLPSKHAYQNHSLSISGSEISHAPAEVGIFSTPLSTGGSAQILYA